MTQMTERYPGYDVLKKRNSPSWNAQTRAVIDERLATDPERHRFFTDAEWQTLQALCDRIIPQPRDREKPAPLAALLDEKLFLNHGDGYRDARLPAIREAWRRGLAAIEAEATLRGRRFAELTIPEQDALLTTIQEGGAHTPTWGDMSPALFFGKRILHDVVSAYYSHPCSWNEIGFGGPASPRGYVRMNFDRRDPWEASEGRPGREAQARRENARVG
jgi:hypothetical protein